MVTVIVDQRVRAAALDGHFAVPLEAPAHAAKLRERLGNRRIPDAGFAADRDRGERIQHVVLACEIELGREGRARPSRGRRSACGRHGLRCRSRGVPRVSAVP